MDFGCGVIYRIVAGVIMLIPICRELFINTFQWKFHYFIYLKKITGIYHVIIPAMQTASRK